MGETHILDHDIDACTLLHYDREQVARRDPKRPGESPRAPECERPSVVLEHRDEAARHSGGSREFSLLEIHDSPKNRESHAVRDPQLSEIALETPHALPLSFPPRPLPPGGSADVTTCGISHKTWQYARELRTAQVCAGACPGQNRQDSARDTPACVTIRHGASSRGRRFRRAGGPGGIAA